MYSNEECLLAMLIRMLVILMLILMLLNLNTGNAETDADLRIRIMSLWCMQVPNKMFFRSTLEHFNISLYLILHHLQRIDFIF